jgi:AcrR family transcriptional regulator
MIETAAERLFAERGYAGTRLDDIAEAAGVAKPMLYRHFESKKAMHLALLSKHADSLLTGIVPNVDPDLPLADRVTAIVDAWFVYAEEHPDGWRLLFRDTTSDAEIRAFQEELHTRARGVVALLIKSMAPAPIGADEVEPLAELIRSAVTRAALWWLDRSDIPRSAMVASTVRILTLPKSTRRT